MKNFVSVALLAAAVSATACGTSMDPPVDTSAQITAHWSFSTYDTFAHNGAPTDPCPTDFDTAAVHARPWDPFLGQFTASDMPPDKFNCSAKGGTTDPLDGIFQVWVSIESHSGATVYAESESVIIDTADGDSTITLPTLFKDAGFADFSWDLMRGATRLRCSDAGITSTGFVNATASANSSTFMATDKFDCTDGFGITAPLPADDDYTVTLTAVGSPGHDIGVSDPETATIIAPNGLDHVGHLKIIVQ